MGKALVKTMSLKDLLSHWNYSLDNIYELADEGYFGLYINPLDSKPYVKDITQHIKLITDSADSDKDKLEANQLKSAYINFVTRKANICGYKKGYERLATTIECKFWPLCTNSSIDYLRSSGRINFSEHGNSFGIVKIDGRFISNTYAFVPSQSLSPFMRFFPEDYKGYFSQQDIMVFVDQINAFENDKQKEKTTRTGRIECIKGAIEKIILAAYQDGVIIEQHRMPGIKREWIEMSLMIEPSLKAYSTHTLIDYLRETPYRFLQGQHENSQTIILIKKLSIFQ